MKKFIAIATAAVASAATPAAAFQTDHEAHQRLWNTIQDVGVETYLNMPGECDKSTAGFYRTDRRGPAQLVICQENSYPGGKQVGWTAEDYDTLRHEAQHLLQDCLAGGIADGRYDTLFEGEKLTEFVMGGLTTNKIEWILDSYGAAGVSDLVLLQELEAFAVAESVPADSIAKGIKEVCTYRL